MPLREEQGPVNRWFGTNTAVTATRQPREQLERACQDLEIKATFRTLALEAPAGAAGRPGRVAGGRAVKG